MARVKFGTLVPDRVPPPPPDDGLWARDWWCARYPWSLVAWNDNGIRDIRRTYAANKFEYRGPKDRKAAASAAATRQDAEEDD